MTQERKEQQALEILVVEIDDLRLGLYCTDVLEIVRAVAMTRLPKAPDIVEGVINFRGTVIPVLDVRARFGLPPKPIDPSQQMVIAVAGERRVVFRTDRAVSLETLSRNEIEDARRIVKDAPYVAGVAKLPDGMAVIHDLRTFLTAAEMAALSALDCAESTT